MDEVKCLTPEENYKEGRRFHEAGKHKFEQGLYGQAQDFKKAAEFYTLAAGQGNALAQHWLGYFYQYNISVSRNKIKAVRLYKLAADQGDGRSKEGLTSGLLDSALKDAVANKNTKDQDFISEIILTQYIDELDAAIKSGKEYDGFGEWGVPKSEKLSAVRAFLSFYKGESKEDILKPHTKALLDGNLFKKIQNFSEKFSKAVLNLKPTEEESFFSSFSKALFFDSKNEVMVAANIQPTSNAQDENTQDPSIESYINSTL